MDLNRRFQQLMKCEEKLKEIDKIRDRLENACYHLNNQWMALRGKFLKGE